MTSGAARRRRIIYLLVPYLLQVASHRSDDKSTAVRRRPPSASASLLLYYSTNTCPSNLLGSNLISQPNAPSSIAAPPPPLQDGGDDLHPDTVTNMMADQELSKEMVAEVVLLAFSTFSKEERMAWEIMLIPIFRSAVYWLLLFLIPLRYILPRFAQLLEQLILIVFLNGVVVFFLPPEWLWVPAVCFSSSLLALIIALRLR